MIKFIIIGLLAVALMVFIYEDSWIVGIVVVVFMLGSLIGSLIMKQRAKHSDSPPSPDS